MSCKFSWHCVCSPCFIVKKGREKKFCSKECANENRRDKIEKTCKTCGKKFYIIKSNEKQGRGKYCSQKCFNETKSKPVKRICQTCGKEFYEKPSTIKKGYGKYCSRTCIGTNSYVMKTCEYCKKEFKIHKGRINTAKCCSTKCAYKLKTKNALTTTKCKTCGKTFTIKKSQLAQGRGKFCSRKCNAQELIKTQSGEKSTNWRGGLSFEPYCPKFSKDLRRRIREFFEHRCICCGKHETELKQKLSCHHVEYDKTACCTGMPVHFAALCRKHHATTNHNRERWESMLHRIIDEIYDGKSYYTKEEYAKLGENPDD